jgi:hypothetical protein
MKVHIDHEDHGHPSQSTAGRFPEDQALRRRGYAIAARPKGREPVWLLHGVRFTQSEALAREGVFFDG